MPKAAKVASILVQLPPNMANAGWDIDPDFVIRFAKRFGIKCNISFRWASGKYRRGTHYSRRDSAGNWTHHIVLNQNRSIESARNTILHELCHAIQTERFENPNVFWKEYSGYNHSGRHYQSENPFEIEAVRFADDNLAEWGEILY